MNTIPRMSRVMPLLVIFVLLMSSVAVADNVQNDVVVGDTDTITPGGSTTVHYHISATGQGNDGQSGCNAADGSAATVTINAPAGVTATPSSLVFTACGTAAKQSVLFSSSAVGNHLITVSVADPGSTSTYGTYTTNQASFTLKVQAPADTTPPQITPVLDPAAPDGSNGWYRSDVSLSWTVTEPETPASVVKTGCAAVSVTADQAATSYSCQATSSGGASGVHTVSIKRDATPPTSQVTGVTDGAILPVPPTVGCQAADSLSGVATHGTPSGDTTTPGLKTVTCNGATDMAGNTQTTASSAVSYTLAPIGGFNANFDSTTNVLRVKPNQAIPLRWAFSDGTTNHALLSAASLSSVSSTRCTSAAGTDGTEVATEIAAGASGLQLLPDDAYQMNWKATSTTGCRALTVHMTFAAGGAASRTILVNIVK